MILHPNSHYFVPMMKFGDYGLAIACSDVERTHMVECKIKPYHDNSYDYKVYAIPVDPSDEAIYMNIAFYTKTFEELIKEGKIVEKTSDNMKVVPVMEYEHISGSAYYVHEGEDIVVED